METTPEISRLPKWAQEYIGRLIRHRNDAETKLKDYLDEQAKSLIYTQDGLDPKRFLQTDRVKFVVPNGVITVDLRNAGLECNATYSSAELLVRPVCSNVVDLEIRGEKQLTQ